MISINDISVDKNLTQHIANLMDRVGSDKNRGHNYPSAYAYFFSKVPSLEKINFLEIGIAIVEKSQSSMHAWNEIFKNSNIYGIDIDPKRMIDEDNLHTFVADQGSALDLFKFLEKAGRPKFDIILDDGSHHQSDAQVSFEFLINHLTKNGIYLIEDIRKSPGNKESENDLQQTVLQWEEFLQKFDDIEWEVLDCRPEQSHDDSVVLGIWKIK